MAGFLADHIISPDGPTGTAGKQVYILGGEGSNASSSIISLAQEMNRVAVGKADPCTLGNIGLDVQ